MKGEIGKSGIFNMNFNTQLPFLIRTYKDRGSIYFKKLRIETQEWKIEELMSNKNSKGGDLQTQKSLQKAL